MVHVPIPMVRSEVTLSSAHEVQPAWANVVRNSWTDLSVLLCAVLLVIFCLGGQQPVTKHGKGTFTLLMAIWYWTTTTWAAETKEILSTFRSSGREPGFPLLGFWLAFLPSIASAGIFVVGLYWRSGSSAARKLFVSSHDSGVFWLVAGAAFWYGHFFTVQSLVFGSPALTFCVKAAEPLSTALLAVVVLRNGFSFRLLLGIFVACLGVMLTVISAGHPHGTHFGSRGQLAGLAFGLLGNLGFSSRACVAKKALLQKRVDALETCGMLTVVGAQTGLLPLFAYVISGHVGLAPGGSAWMYIFFDPRFSARGWLMMCLSHTLCQTCSVLVLSRVAVESHALLVALKHMLVAVFVSILVHTHLTRGVMLGMVVTLLGVYIYMGSAKEDSTEVQEDGTEAKEESTKARLSEAEAEVKAILRPEQKSASAWEVPATLQGIVLAVVMLGAATPSVFSALRLSSAADI